ncbi:hypothetical protein MNBD_BACTEROID02-1257 [hydrothermal vent metagenome]|uniref:Uncharacterized protein n=1 Tax=hydrothermal vent metagenome TaxID=652676 RepID=A0A3B0RDW7_9ZZZZ|nr:hypothetical protein [Chlorobiota bacterium]
MKFLAFILSIYILALNFAPCEDNVTVGNDVNVEVSQSGDIDHSHNNLDLCSPFCQCHCCHVHVTYLNLEDFTAPLQKIPTDIFLHFDSLGKDITNSILQPPRV